MRGVYPGTFDPPTIAHVAIAEAALRQCRLETLDLVVSHAPLGKDATHAPVDDRVAVLGEIVTSRPGLAVRVTEHRLLADIAAGYDVLVMGADKWAQVLDPAWYGSEAARDAALGGLPRVLVAPRAGFTTEGCEVLDLPEWVGETSSTAVRAGRRELMAPEAVAYDARTGVWSRRGETR